MGNMSRWVLILGLTGCSLSMQGPDPNRPHGQPQTCDTGKAPVVLDGLAAASFGVAGLAATSAGSSSAGLVLLGAGALFTATAIHGSHVADTCRAAQAQTQVEVARAVPLPMPAAVPAAAPRPEPPPEYSEPAPPPPPRPKQVEKTSDDPWRDFWKVVP